jgi:hypothetical protein
MFPPAVYTRAWSEEQSRQLGRCDPGLLEKCVYALTLLGYLSDSGLPFLFKGGTSLLLHLSVIRRLSIDIDIVSPAANAELERVVAAIGETAPFIGAEESIRSVTGERDVSPMRRHFKFWFRTERAIGGRACVLLDVVQEPHCPHEKVTRPIRTSFLTPDREIAVTLPTVESLLGDKLTAFAPTTTGVKLRRKDGTEGEVMQVAKQLFDVGTLFEHATDFAQVARVYDGVQAQEAGYRGHTHTREATLADTFSACLGITGTKKAQQAVFADTPLILDGFRKLGGHLTLPRFGDEDRRTLAARAAVLTAHLRTGRPFDFSGARYTGSAAQLAALRAATLNGHEHAWLESIKAVNAEAYHYWHMGLKL